MFTQKFVWLIWSISTAVALGQDWSLETHENYHYLFVTNVTIDFAEGRTERVVFQGDISDSLPIRVPQEGVSSLTYCNSSVINIDSFCFTESVFSSFANDTNVLLSGFICPLSVLPTDRFQLDFQCFKDSFEKEQVILKAKKSMERIVWFNIQKTCRLPYTHNFPRCEQLQVLGNIFEKHKKINEHVSLVLLGAC